MLPSSSLGFARSYSAQWIHLLVAFAGSISTDTGTKRGDLSSTIGFPPRSPSAHSSVSGAKSSDVLTIEYFLIQVDLSNFFPGKYKHTALHKRDNSLKYKLKACMVETMRVAEQLMEQAVSQALVHYQRDDVWQRIFYGREGAAKDPPDSPFLGIQTTPYISGGGSMTSPGSSLTSRSTRGSRGTHLGFSSLHSPWGTLPSVGHTGSSQPSSPARTSQPVPSPGMSSVSSDPSIPITPYSLGRDIPDEVVELENFSDHDLEIFRTLTFRRPLEVVDSSLSDLASVGVSGLGAVLGRPFLTYLKRLYGARVRQLTRGDTHHLFIVNNYVPDVMLHAVIKCGLRNEDPRRRREGSSSVFSGAGEDECGPNQFKLFACRRVLHSSADLNANEDANSHYGDLSALELQAERDMVTDVTNHICHFLWEQMMNWLED